MDTTAQQPQPDLSPTLQSADALLRNVPFILERIRESRDLAAFAKAMILTIAIGSGVFGAALGTYRGGIQILYAGMKLPLVLLLTLAICAPALTALNRAVGRNGCLRRDIALVLASLARASLLLAAQAPIVLLSISANASYHLIILVVVGCCALAGLVGLMTFLQGLRSRELRGLWTVTPALFLVLILVGSQMSWVLRPYLLRPRTPDVVFIRSVEGSFLDSVLRSSQSARGVYKRPSAPLPTRSMGEP